MIQDRLSQGMEVEQGYLYKLSERYNLLNLVQIDMLF